MNKAIAVVVAIVVVGLGYRYFQGNYAEKKDKMGATSTPEEAMMEKEDGEGAVMTKEGNVVVYGNDGYSPSEITVKAGESVTFQNDSSRGTWPATARHPTHTIYPGSDIAKCGTAEAEGIFDACGEISPGSSWSFIFTEAGEWAYHDHVNAGYFGRVVVE